MPRRKPQHVRRGRAVHGRARPAHGRGARHARRHGGRPALAVSGFAAVVAVAVVSVFMPGATPTTTLRPSEDSATAPGVPHTAPATTTEAGTTPTTTLAAAPTTSTALATTSTAPAPRRSQPAKTKAATAPARGRAPSAPAPPTPAQGAPHVMVVMMENEGYDQIMGSTAMPYTNALAAGYGVATASYGTAHPSLPNYLEMISGSTQGVTADVSPPSPLFTGTTLAGQLSAAGYSTQAYAEDLPADPTADSGTYVVHHDPWEYFAGTPAVAPATALLGALDGAAAPDFVWFTPDAVDDGDLTAPQATILADEDAFLSSFIPSIQATPWYAAGGQIVIEWDEALDADTSGIAGGAGGHALTIVVSSALHGHPVQDAAPVATAGILHSIEKVYGLPYLGDAANPAEGNIDPLL